MTATGTSEANSDFSHEKTESILGESDPVSSAPPPVREVAPPEPTFEDDGSEPVNLEPQGGKNLVDELSFNENPVAVVDPSGLSAMGEAAAARGYLWILLRTPGPQYRGRLGLYIEETIENHLEERGALPPGIHASTGLDASLSDQLYRARLVEMRGIALGVPSLEGITNLGRVLDAEDSAVLRWWMAATSDRPVRMVLSQENTKLRVYPSPVFFQSLFEVAPGLVTPIPPSPAMAASAAAMELSDLPPQVEAKGSHAETNVFGTEVASWESLAPELSSEGETEASRQDDLGKSDLEAESSLSATNDDWDRQNEDVALPDLDRALGLSPPPVESEPQPVHRDERPRRSSVRAGASQQLELTGLEPTTPTPGPHTQALLAELDAEAEQAPVLGASHAEPTEAPVAPEETARFSENEVSVKETSSRQALASDEAMVSDAWSGSDATDIDDIDTEEFLRTLEEDSSRAPEVSAAEVTAPDTSSAEEADSQEQGAALDEGEPTPLPTKKIKRNPFIRLADQAELSTELVPDAPVAASELEVPSQSEALPANPGANDSKSELTESAASAAVIEPPMADPADPFNQLAAREWKTWVRNLEAARGPKPLSVIERMFVTDYTRLREAVRRGVAETSANDILNEWQGSFTTSYSEAFDALRVRGKRPTMVLDLPELASRLGRLQGARRVQLLMVDGLRFDLGLMVQERMRNAADASLTERLLLWSALPSVTSYQLELLGKGPDGLKEPGDIDEAPALVARGAAARSPRRVRTGSLELLKLDIVADAIRQPGAPILERMDAIADDTASAIIEHLEKQAPRTMVVVFGDHGFAIDANAAGTTEEVKQGGASPEEVLVPAFAWLTGAVH